MRTIRTISWEETLHVGALRGLVDLIDERDAGLAGHSTLVSGLAARTAQELGLPAAQVGRIALAGMVHDVGKVALPDSILVKPGPLDEAEWRAVQAHPEHGARLIEAAGLHDVAEWVLTHHERVDGRGYPHGRVGDEIPLEGRILAVVDAYEAMTAERVYSGRMDRDAALGELRRCSGTQFDAAVVDSLLRVVEPVAA